MVVVDSRIARCVENYEGGESVEGISDNFGIPQKAIRELPAYAAREKQPQG